MADPSAEDEAAFSHPRCFEEVYPAEDVIASGTAFAAAASGSACAKVGTDGFGGRISPHLVAAAPSARTYHRHTCTAI